jgi:predicted enzyme related to lactoylglutathione lyase
VHSTDNRALECGMAEQQHEPGSFNWFECGSTDADAAKHFYVALFGWTAVDVPLPGDAQGHYTLFKIEGEDVAGLYEMSGEQFEGALSHWMTYLAVVDVDASTREAGSIGGTVMGPPMDVPGVGRIAFIADPTGARFALFTPREHPGSAQLGPIPGTFGWGELATRDTRTAEAFYSKMFGWTPKVDPADPMQYTEFQLGGRSFAGMTDMLLQPDDVPPHWLPHVLVEDCDELSARIEGIGGRLMMPPTDLATVGRFAVLADPAGAAIAILQR